MGKFLDRIRQTGAAVEASQQRLADINFKAQAAGRHIHDQNDARNQGGTGR